MTSKAQDIVENWEEIDEERLNSRLETLAKVNDGSPVNGVGAGGNSKAASSNSLPVMLEEELRPRIILQRPQMQILRRPQANVQEEKSTAESKPKTQIKSLDQRKQEYAEARLRILGSAHDEEEQQQKPFEPTKKTNSNTNGNGFRLINNNNSGGPVRPDRPQGSYRPPPGSFHMQQHAQHTGPYYSPHPSARNQVPPPEAANHHYYQQQAPHPSTGPYPYQHPQHHPQSQHYHQKHVSSYGMAPQTASGYHQAAAAIAVYGHVGANNSNNNILRMPAGPDGSHGFTIRR
ncbi:SUZ domain-containing protein 1 [Toxorhynchites rutilus septentrionalis]|uniref:SUZ domain-containing protein 1 n=1 Tax=Toxorhynchites rutilus septentrionalis TaxID=329112 RepID=UPI002478BC66|nr:SUZ domain-containing protein 1 [Toxorhynchites rutilus septentrionalis]